MGTNLGGLRRALVVAMATALTLGVMTMSPAHAGRAITFDVYLGDACVYGRAGNKVQVKVMWRDSDGSVKQAGATKANGKGYWFYCGDRTEHVEQGDTVRATVGAQSRAVTVPRLKAHADRDANVVSGRAISGATLTIEVCTRYSFDWAHCREWVTDAAPDGRFSHGFGGSVDMLGRDWFEVRMKEGADTFNRWMYVPYVTVTRGSARFGGYYRPFRSLTIDLVDGAATKDSWTGRADGSGYGSFHGRFTDADGHGEWVRTGDRIVSGNPGFSADWTVPPVAGTVNKKTDVVKGTCYPNRPFKVTATNPAGTKTVKALGKSSTSGSFKRDLTKKMDVKSRTVVWIMCSLPSGDVVQRRIVTK